MDKKSIKHIRIFFSLWGMALVAMFIVAFVCAGCDNRVIEHDLGYDITYGVRVIEGCQYIIISPYCISHKGNCTNSIHIYKAENGK